MANRQYIGARYVPQFFDNDGSNEWVSGIAYNALTIVTYLYNSYTSRKYVPSSVGSPNLNPEYWICTGNVTGAVEQLEGRMDDAETAITALNGSVDTLDGRIDSLDAYNQHIPMKVLCIGDSYGMKITNNWTKYLKDYLGLDNNHFVNMCTGNAGFVGNSAIATNFYNQLVNATNKDTFTHIIIVGGFNDAYDNQGNSATREQILSAMSNCMTYIKANYPNVVKVLLGNPSYVTNVGGEYQKITNLRTVIRNCKNYYAQCCGQTGIGYMKSMESIMHSKQCYKLDDVTYGMVFHPNEVGGQLIAYTINSYLHGGDMGIHLNNVDVITPESDFSFQSDAYCYSLQDNESVEFVLKLENNLISTTRTDITAQAQYNDYKVGSISPTNFFTMHDGDSFYVGCRAVTSTSESLYGGLCKITLRDDGLYISPRFANYTGYITRLFLDKFYYKGEQGHHIREPDL